MISPVVSVVLCTFNNEAFISQAIKSILNQTFKSLELIIINDGSTDNTKENIFKFKDNRIRYYENSKNLGLEKSKNFGISKCRGKYIAFMDGDDECSNERIESQVEVMENDNNISICGTLLKYTGLRHEVSKRYENDFGLRFEALFGVPLPHASSMIRRKILIEHDINYELGFEAAEDYLYLCKIISKGKSYCIQHPHYYYRWHGKNTSIIKKEKQIKSHLKTQFIAIEMLLGLKLSEEEILLFTAMKRNNVIENFDFKKVIKLYNILTSKEVTRQTNDFIFFYRIKTFKMFIAFSIKKLLSGKISFIQFAKFSASESIRLTKYLFIAKFINV